MLTQLEQERLIAWHRRYVLREAHGFTVAQVARLLFFRYLYDRGRLIG
jgi:hypothetical protein